MGERGRISSAGRRADRVRPPCLLLVPRGFEAPAELVAGLHHRAVPLAEVGDAPSVMVALARRRYLAVVIIEPDAVTELHGLAAAVRRYHPGLPLWRYRACERPRLDRLVLPECQAAPAPAPARAAAPAASTSRPRADAGDVIPSEPAPTSEPEPTSAPDGGREAERQWGGPVDDREQEPPEIRVTLTEEELTMLLGDNGTGEGERR